MTDIRRPILFRGVIRTALLCAAAGAIGAILGWIFDPRAFYYGYLAGFVLWIGVPLGAAAILMTHYLASGRWGLLLRPSVESAAVTTPLLALLFLPVILGIRFLYPWADPARVAQSPTLTLQHQYMNAPGWIIRSLVFLLIWSAGAIWLAWRSRRVPSAQLTAPSLLSGASAIGMVVYVFTLGFAGYDWIASLQAEWYSSMIGIYVFIGQALTALAVLIIAVAWVRRRAAGREAVPAAVLHDLGNLLLALVVFHAYIAFSQFFITWNGNLPRPISWYFPRSEGVWGWLLILLLFIHFLLPLAALLSRRVSRRQGPLVTVAAVLLVAQALEAVWFVLPAAAPATESNRVPAAPGGPWIGIDPVMLLMALASMVAIGGLWTAAFAWQWRRWRPVLGPVHAAAEH